MVDVVWPKVELPCTDFAFSKDNAGSISQSDCQYDVRTVSDIVTFCAMSASLRERSRL